MQALPRDMFKRCAQPASKYSCLQIEREAAKVNERHGWYKLGDAWGYRRRAYRRMAELLQALP